MGSGQSYRKTWRLTVSCRGPGYPLRVGFRVVDDTVNPYSQQGSFEIQREVAGYALSAAYNYNRGVHLIRPLDLNIYEAGADPTTGRPVPGFRNPLILQDNAYGSWGRSYYHAMIVQLKKRFSDGFTISAHHTWSKAIDEATDYNSSTSPTSRGRSERTRPLPLSPRAPFRRTCSGSVPVESS